MATKDLVISSYGPDLSDLVAKLARPAILVPVTGQGGTEQWVSKYGSLDAIFKSHGGGGHTLGRVAVLGFSAGCGGIYGAIGLGGKIDPRIDCVLAIDGVAGGCSDNGKSLTVRDSMVKLVQRSAIVSETAPVTDSAGAPMSNPSPVTVITASSIGAGGCVVQNSITTGERQVFAPTKDISKILQAKAIAATGGTFQSYTMPGTFQAQHVLRLKNVVYPNAGWPVGASKGGIKCTEAGLAVRNNSAIDPSRQKTYMFPSLWHNAEVPIVVNNSYFFSWKNQDIAGGGNADHIFQGTPVARAMFEEFVLNRWNPVCTTKDGVSRRVYSFADPVMYSGASCTPGSGVNPSTQPAIPVGPGDTGPEPVPTICMKGDGTVFVLGPDAVCPGPVPPMPPPTPGGSTTTTTTTVTTSSSPLALGLSLLTGTAVGYAISRWWIRRRK